MSQLIQWLCLFCNLMFSLPSAPEPQCATQTMLGDVTCTAVSNPGSPNLHTVECSYNSMDAGHKIQGISFEVILDTPLPLEATLFCDTTVGYLYQSSTPLPSITLSQDRTAILIEYEREPCSFIAGAGVMLGVSIDTGTQSYAFEATGGIGIMVIDNID